jgi:hypothetical protein
LVEEILSLVSIREQEMEEVDEHERATKRGEPDPWADEPGAHDED